MHHQLFAVAAVLAAQVPPDPGLTDGQLLTDTLTTVLEAITSGRAVGGLAIAAVVVAAIVSLTKLTVLRTFLEARGLVWVRPVLATVLGAAGGLLTAIGQGQPIGGVIAAAVAGALAGLTGVGLHELTRVAAPSERGKQRVAEVDLVTTATAMEAALEAKGRSMATSAAVRDAGKLPAGKRVEALAELLRRAP